MSLSQTQHRHLYILDKGGLLELLVKTILYSLCRTHSLGLAGGPDWKTWVCSCISASFGKSPWHPFPRQVDVCLQCPWAPWLSRDDQEGTIQFSSQARNSKEKRSNMPTGRCSRNLLQEQQTPKPNTNYLGSPTLSMSSRYWTAKPKQCCEAGNCSERPGSVCFPIASFHLWELQDFTTVLSSITLQVESQTRTVRGSSVHHRKGRNRARHWKGKNHKQL